MDTAKSDRHAPRSTVVTVGTYDGVHLGHRRLIDEARRQAAEEGLLTIVLTFDRHPATIVRPESAPKLLTGTEHRLELLAGTGADEIVVIAFDAARRNESAEDFVESVLVEQLGAREVMVGSGFRFGHRQRGDLALLEEMGEMLGFTAREVSLVTDGELNVVSSSHIRRLIEAGELDDAARLLGRPHEVRGHVTGTGENGSLRLQVDEDLVMPPSGLYAGQAGQLGAPPRSVQARVELAPTPDGAARIEILPELREGGDAKLAPTGARLTLRFVSDADRLEDPSFTGR